MVYSPTLLLTYLSRTVSPHTGSRLLEVSAQNEAYARGRDAIPKPAN